MAISEARGKKIGLLAFTDNEPPWSAAPQRPGVWHIPVETEARSAELLFDKVREARKQVDIALIGAKISGYSHCDQPFWNGFPTFSEHQTCQPNAPIDARSSPNC